MPDTLVYALGACHACNRVFGFNPYRVPSMPVGELRKPICQSCIALVNAIRLERGQEPHVVLPDAYDPTPLPSSATAPPEQANRATQTVGNAQPQDQDRGR